MANAIPEIVRCPPVLVCGFIRPDFLKRVMDRVRQARPEHLFLALDAPRIGHPTDKDLNDACRQIFDEIDWPCQVSRNYATENMGCRRRMETAIDWILGQVEHAIILEDDCVPDPTFFRFCGELLERYKDDNRVGMIGGHVENLHVAELPTYGTSYYFSRWSSIWGWATWRRAWVKHDKSMSYVDDLIPQGEILDGIYRNTACTRRRLKYLPVLRDGKAGSWDGAWFTTMQINNWLCIHPFKNLISNIGCGQSSRAKISWLLKILHYRSPWDNIRTEAMHFPLQHPLTMLPNVRAERQTCVDFGQIRTLKWYLVRVPYYTLMWILSKLK